MTIEEICNKYIKVKATGILALHQRPKLDWAFKVVSGKESDVCNGCFLEKYYPLRLPYTCAAQEREDGKNVQFKEISKTMITREQAKELLPILQALAEGKQIQDKIEGVTDWVDTDEINFEYEGQKIKHRIKPEPKYRPFKTQEECWNEMLKHQPFGWIYSKNRSCYYCIISVEEDRIELSPREQSRSETPLKEFYLKNYHCFFEEALELFKLTFADGTPFGIKEE